MLQQTLLAEKRVEQRERNSRIAKRAAREQLYSSTTTPSKILPLSSQELAPTEPYSKYLFCNFYGGCLFIKIDDLHIFE